MRWTGFVAGGEAVIGPDGLTAAACASVDHGEAEGRTAWRTVEIAFTGFPAAVAARPPGTVAASATFSVFVTTLPLKVNLRVRVLPRERLRDLRQSWTVTVPALLGLRGAARDLAALGGER